MVIEKSSNIKIKNGITYIKAFSGEISPIKIVRENGVIEKENGLLVLTYSGKK